MDKNLEIAILFREYKQDVIISPIYYAAGVLIGKVSEDTRSFTEYFTGQKYLNLDIANRENFDEGFRFVIKLKELKNSSIFKKMHEIYSSFWKEREKYLYFYSYTDSEEGELVYATPEEINAEFGTNLMLRTVEEDNEMIDLILDGTNEDVAKYFDMHPEYLKMLEEDLEEEFKIEKPISQTVEEMKEYIIAQDEALKKIAIAIYKNLFFDSPTMKSNILMYGPTGSGKTAIINTIAKVIDLPVWTEDMTRFSETGYKGADVDEILVNLYNNANGNLARAERSILFLDEIDKKADNDGEKSFNKSDVLKSLLKIIEGGKFEISINSFETIEFDTSKLTIIVGGAFTDLYKRKEVKHDTVIRGFTTSSEEKENKPISKEITIKDFEKYGMPIEFIGRFKTIIRLNELSLDDMIAILKNAKTSALRNYKEELKNAGIELEIPEKIYKKIAEKAYEFHTGARSLNIVVDKIFEPILYEFFNDKNNVEAVELQEDAVENESGFKLTKKYHQLTIPGYEL